MFYSRAKVNIYCQTKVHNKTQSPAVRSHMTLATPKALAMLLFSEVQHSILAS